jgi:RHS repeat-associated protein
VIYGTHSAVGALSPRERDGVLGRGTPIESPFRLLGQVADEDAELCWTRFRVFDAEVGAWLSPDPLGWLGGLNLFAFAGAPSRVTDTRGLALDGGPPRTMVNPADLRWSQTTAGGRGRADQIRESMSARGWDGPPIDVVRASDGLATVDHTRAAVALEQGITEIPVRIHEPDEPLPADMRSRPRNRQGDTASTWGEAVAARGAGQDPPIGPTGSATPLRLPRR